MNVSLGQITLHNVFFMPCDIFAPLSQPTPGTRGNQGHCKNVLNVLTNVRGAPRSRHGPHIAGGFPVILKKMEPRENQEESGLSPSCQ